MDESDRPLAGNVVENIAPERAGTATIEPAGDIEAGSYATFKLVYTAGFYGIDDSGSLKIVFRHAADHTRPQTEDPAAPNYVTAVASNDAILEVRYDPKLSVRPWDRTLYIKVVQGFMKEGDTIAITFGDTGGGSPGMRVQTFCEDTFEFRVLADPVATYAYVALPEQPTIRIVPGPPETWRAVLPTGAHAGEPFRLSLKAEDRWGNPSDRVDATVSLRANLPVRGLPETVALEPGRFARVIEDLTVDEPGVLRVEARDESGALLAESNPMEVVAGEGGLRPYWGDLHGQTEETIGTNSARAYFLFARDRAFLDVVGHQGNDFQITRRFWAELNGLMGAFDAPGRFVTLPGYEWSGNTALGGDRNVFYRTEDRPIYRSSHALVDDRSDIDTDCGTAAVLFERLAQEGEDAICIAHCGGRYADVKYAHDGRFETAVEVHSSWGTFEWIVQDALEMGYRVGIVANSDGHKGRPGASYPGAAHFGAIGGLTCLLMPELSRDAVFECLRARRHYGTTGNRMILEVTAAFEGEGQRFAGDPSLGPATSEPVAQAMMGDIVQLSEGGALLKVRAVGSAPIERIDVFNGLDHVATHRPYAQGDLGNRIRVVWEGAEYRGRFRQVVWDGTASFGENRILDAVPINFFNRDKTLARVGETGLEWRALTTGNFGGFDAWLAEPAAGTLEIRTPPVEASVPLAEIGFEDTVFDAGKLGRRLRLFRLPERNPHLAVEMEQAIALSETGDNPLYVRVTQEDGHQAWSSPIYVFR